MLSIFNEHSYTIRENIMFTKYFTKERLILLNRFRSDAGRECRNSMHEWGYIVSPRSDCDEHQTMRHIVNECPLTCFDGGISELHQAHDAAFTWLLRQHLRSWKQTTTTTTTLYIFQIRQFKNGLSIFAEQLITKNRIAPCNNSTMHM